MNYLRSIIIYISIILCVLYNTVTQAQTTKIMGKVTDKVTKESVPFVTIAFKGGSTGVSTDFNGEYSIETKKASDSIIATCLGYKALNHIVVKNKFQIIDFELEPVSMTLQEVVIKPGKNPAEIILEKIILNKEKNNPENIDYYQCESYNKIQFDANNISEKLKGRKLLKPFKFVFDYIDTSSVNGKAYLPFFITEALSEFYYRSNPKTTKEIIKATKTSGIENKSLSQFLGNMYLHINIYDNFINLFDRNFVSPIANFGLGFYKYYLIDSAYVEGKWCYKLMFKSRRKQELTFTGDMWVNDTSFAIKKINLRIADDANINYINDLVCKLDYNLFPSDKTPLKKGRNENRTNTLNKYKEYWMLSKELFTVDFNVIENTKKIVGFFGNKTTSYRNFVFSTPESKKIYSAPINVIIDDESYNKDDVFWEQHRHDTLDKKERGIYKMVDSITSIPLFQTYVDILLTITQGYYETGNFEIGPYFSIYSFNKIEGMRFRFGGRTSNQFSTRIMPEAYLAYGTKDEKFKYNLSFLYMFSKNPRRSGALYYKKDVEQLGESPNSFITDNILNSLLRRNPSDKLTMVEEYKGIYQHEWFNGFSNSINLFHRDLFPLSASKFSFHTGYSEKIKKSITSSELRLDLRFAYKEKYILGEFERVSMGTNFPVLNVQYSFGFKDILNGDYEYRKLLINIEHWFNLRTYGWSKYMFEAGKIWGVLPYPLLKLHEGNETYSFDQYSYNMMNYYEFVSDKYLSFYYTHHFDGYFLNHIPLLRKLKWREVAYIKGVTGTLSNDNLIYNKKEMGEMKLNKLGIPYLEAAVGIENIFKVIRVDAIRRLSYINDPVNHPNVSKYGFMFTLQIIL